MGEQPIIVATPPAKPKGPPMTDDDTSPVPPVAAEHVSFVHRPSFLRVRAVLLVLSLLAFWGVMAHWWFDVSGDDFDDPLFDAGRLAVTAGLALLTGLWIASIRYVRLRQALLPIEAGVVVGIAIIVIGVRGVEVDTNEDAAFLAVLIGIGTTIVVGVLAKLVEGRRSAPYWIGAVMLAAVFLGAGLPAIADGLTSEESNGWSGGAFGNPVMTRFTNDGAVRLTRDYLSTNVVDMGYTTTEGPFTDGAMPDDAMPDGTCVGELCPMGLPAGPGESQDPPVPTVRVELSVQAAEPLELQLSALTATDAQPVQLAVRRGSCIRPNDRDIDRWTATTPSQASQRTLGSVGLGAQSALHLVMGTAQPLAPVRCVDLVDPIGVRLALNGGLEFGRDCIAPLRLDSQARLALTAASLQDKGCADRFEDLDVITAGTIVADDQAVARAKACLASLDVVTRSVRLKDGSTAMQLADGTGPDVYGEAMACIDGGAMIPEGPAGI